MQDRFRERSWIHYYVKRIRLFTVSKNTISRLVYDLNHQNYYNQSDINDIGLLTMNSGYQATICNVIYVYIHGTFKDHLNEVSMLVMLPRVLE